MDASTTSDASTKGAAKTRPTKEQHRQLLIHHMSKLRQKGAEITALRAPLKTAQDEFTVLVNEAKNDLGKGYTRKYLTTLLEDATTRLRNLLAEEERRAADREALGLPVFGVQADLFGEATAKMPDEARDEIHWEAEGFMRGRNGLLEALPEGCPPRFQQAVLRGYEKGQQLTQEDFLKGQEFIAQRGQPDAGADGRDLNAEEDEDADLDEAARALKRSGFMETSGETHDNFTAPAEELAGQKPRRAVQEAKAADPAGELEQVH